MEQLSKLERIEALEAGLSRIEKRLEEYLGGEPRGPSIDQDLSEIRSRLRELSETTRAHERVVKRMEDATQQVKETAPDETAPDETGTLETPENPETPETATA